MTTHTISHLYSHRVLYDALCEPVGVEFRCRYGWARKRVVMFDDHETCFDWASMSYDEFFEKYRRGKRRPLLFKQAGKVTT